MAPKQGSRAFWVQEPGRGEILRRDLPPWQGGDILVRALYSGISRGTESLVFRGRVPRSQHEAMRAPFQEGDFPAPVKYGYSSVGEVIEAEGRAGRELLGRRVFCLYPHQDVYIVPASAATRLSPRLPPGRAILAANMETAVNAVWDGGPSTGDRVVVIGAGVVGLLIAWLCRQIPGTEVIAVDRNPDRVEAAVALGIGFRNEPPGDIGADLVFHASGNPAGLRGAIGAAGVEGSVVEVSWYGDSPVSLPLGEAFHSRRLLLRSSQVGRIPPGRSPRWNTSRRLALALSLLRDPDLDVLISGESDFEELPAVMTQLSTAPGEALCHRIRYPAALAHEEESA